MDKYVLAKSSRCYYGGEGRRNKEYDTIREAMNGAMKDGNPVGFDIYVKIPFEQHLWPAPSRHPEYPVMKWIAIRELTKKA